MDYETAKAFILNFYTRFLASWCLKALSAFFAAHGYNAEQSGQTATAVISGLLAAAVFVADLWHSKASVTQAVKVAPNDPPEAPKP